MASRTMILKGLWITLALGIGFFAQGADIKDTDPETHVSISVFDLLGSKPHIKSKNLTLLQRQYVEEVIKLLIANKKDILSCLSQESEFNGPIHLEIDNVGK